MNEAFVCVTGYIATQPKRKFVSGGTCMITMRVGWTPRIVDRRTGDWVDQPTSFVSVLAYRKVAENAAACLRRGDPVVVRGRLRVREYTDQAGVKRISVDVTADTLGHDMSRGTSLFAKTQQHSEQTALEHEQALAAAAGRVPLPGDVADRELADGQDADSDYGDDLDPLGEAEAGPDEAAGQAGSEVPEASSDGEESFESRSDDPDAARPLELVGALS